MLPSRSSAFLVHRLLPADRLSRTKKARDSLLQAICVLFQRWQAAASTGHGDFEFARQDLICFCLFADIFCELEVDEDRWV